MPLPGEIMAHVLKNDQLELKLLPEWGCYWKTLQVFFEGEWRDLLEPMPDNVPPFHFGSYMMAPWSNRLPEGKFKFKGKNYQLKVNFPDNTTIHGDVRYRHWNIEKAQDHHFIATLDSRNFSDFNYPFPLIFTHELILNNNQLSMSIFMENVGKEECPVGGGFHPFFKRRLTERDQDAVLLLPAEKVYPDIKCIPTGPAQPVSGLTDLRTEKLLGNPNLDHCYTALTSNMTKLIYPGSKVELHYEADPIFSHTVIYAPQNEEGKPKDFVAIEPVTHVNNGFNLHETGWKGTGIKILKPKEKWGGTCKLTIHGLK